VPLLKEKIVTSILFTAIETDDGIIGYGLTRGSQRFGLKEFINREAGPFLRGKNPLETERIWNQLYKQFNPRAQTGMWSSAVSAIGNAVGTATTAASNVAQGAAANPNATNVLDPNAYFTDELFRLPAGATAPQGVNLADVRGEAGRILASGAVSGSVSDPDKAYLAQLVSQSTGLPADQAKTRVDDTLKAIDDAKAKAAEAAETARKMAVIAAFLTAASLLVSAVGAYWSAMKGGRHRDEGTVFADVFGRY